MSRILVLVEGETEESFVTEVLAPHLSAHGYQDVSPKKLGPAAQRQNRGGIIGWDAARGDIVRHLKQDRTWLVTTMVDYYALPQTPPKAWPGRAEATQVPFARKAATVQEAVRARVSEEMGRNFDAARFLPFVVMHEFEGLLFSDCTGFANGIGRPELASEFQAIRDDFTTPEEINDSPQTAPSKRVQGLVPGYTKPLLGTLAALEIGLAAIRAECPNFREWIENLEAWRA